MDLNQGFCIQKHSGELLSEKQLVSKFTKGQPCPTSSGLYRGWAEKIIPSDHPCKQESPTHTMSTVWVWSSPLRSLLCLEVGRQRNVPLGLPFSMSVDFTLHRNVFNKAHEELANESECVRVCVTMQISPQAQYALDYTNLTYPL